MFLNDWLKQPCGQLLWSLEAQLLESILLKTFGYYYLQLGAQELQSLSSFSRALHKVFVTDVPYLGSLSPSAFQTVQAHGSALPFLTDSIDTVCLPHVLEHTSQPHELLREVSRIMIPEGNLIVTGFNPWSLWGVRCGIQRLISIRRLRDWLSLLDFEITSSHCFFFRPPLNLMMLQNRLSWLEPIGRRYAPVMGAVYCFVAVKRVRMKPPLTPNMYLKRRTATWEGIGTSCS